MLTVPDFLEKSIVMCFVSEGQKVSFKNDNVIITDAEENIVLQTSCYKIFALWIIGHTTLTSGIMERSKKFAFPICFFSYSYRPYGVWNCAAEGNFLLRQKQYAYNGLEIAHRIVFNKISNQTQLLKSIRGKTEEVVNAIHELEEYLCQCHTASDLHTLLGIEGISTRVYFQHWFNGMEWKGRKPRTKIDPINTTLDIGYTLLFHFIEALLNLYGFDIYQGVYHKCFYQRKSLVCDLVEPFRCIIDKQIKRAYGLKQLQYNDFDERKGQFFLQRDNNKKYTRFLMESILKNKEEMFKYVQEYYRCFMRSKPIEQYPFFHIEKE